MADGKNLFPEAENDKYDISNVLNILNDEAYTRKIHSKSAITNNEDASAVEINVEEGAPFKDGIDLDASIGDYMELNEEEPFEEAAEEVTDEVPFEEAPDEIEEADQEEPEAIQDIEESIPNLEAPQGVRSPVITKQVQKARDKFTDDLRMLDNESAIRRLKEIDEQQAEAQMEEEAQEASMKAQKSHKMEEPLEKEAQIPDEADEEDDDDVLTFKQLISSGARRVKKPRFSKKKAEVEEKDQVHTENEDENGPVDALEALKEEQAAKEQEGIHIMDEGILQEVGPQDALDKKEEATSQEAAKTEKVAPKETKATKEAAPSETKQSKHSVYDDLMELQKYLEEARSPMMHKTEVLVPREKTLRLIRSLTALGEVDPSYIEGVAEDKLIDHIVSEHSGEEYEPLKRAHQRAQTIIQTATKQADIIISDAKTLSMQLLSQTESEIKEKYDDADVEIAVRMNTTKEESSKKLNQARSELTSSRQHSVEILNKYLEKAESDYQGYWERAENTMMASLEQSESFLAKAENIYAKELAVIRQDKEELEEILEHLKRYRRF